MVRKTVLQAEMLNDRSYSDAGPGFVPPSAFSITELVLEQERLERAFSGVVDCVDNETVHVSLIDMSGKPHYGECPAHLFYPSDPVPGMPFTYVQVRRKSRSIPRLRVEEQQAYQ